MKRNFLQAAGLPEPFGSKLRAISVLSCMWPMFWAVLLAASSDDYSITAWQTGDGLPQDSATSLVQTTDGYLWVATFNGLARFDGVRFTVFDEGNTPALQSSRLVRLDVDHEGRLWIITEQGALAWLCKGRFRSWTAEDGVPAAGVAGVVRGPNRSVLLVDRGGGVSRLEGERWVPEPRYDFFRGKGVSLSIDREEHLWAWSLRNLAHIDGGEVVWLEHPDGGGKPKVRSLCHSRDGGLWLLIADRVWHYRCKPEEWKATEWVLPEGLQNLTCMLEDRQGNLWLSSYRQGLVRFSRDGVCDRFTTSEGLSHNSVRALWEDGEGNLWVGTDGGGLNRLIQKTLRTYDVSDGLSGDVVMSIAPDRQDPNALWLALNGGGINHFRDWNLPSPKIEQAFVNNGFIYGLLEDRQGGMWVGAYNAGILHYKDRSFSRLDHSNQWSGTLLTTVEDQSGAIWLGGSFGLLRYEAGELTELNTQIGWSNVTVRALAVDRAGTLYVGSYGKGLWQYARGEWTNYGEGDGLADDHISCLYVDRKDRLWIGTVNGGLSQWNRRRFANLTVRQGLPSNSISSIIEDDHGSLWLGSNRGLFRVRHDHLDEVAEGERWLVTGSTYGLPEGLATLDCGGGAQPAACQTQDGRLWFATVKGLTVVDPANLRPTSFPVPVVIEKVLVDGRAVGVSILDDTEAKLLEPAGTEKPDRAAPSYSLGNEAHAGLASSPPLILPAGSERVEFRFTGLSFLAPERVRFRYRMEGFDNDWVDGEHLRSAFYTRIPAGDYTFHLSACNRDGIWSEPGVALAISVLPPWWSTWWFRLASGLILFGACFGWYELRIAQVRRQHALQEHFSRQLIMSQENERRRIASELHDGLGQNLVLIRNRAELGLRQLHPPPPVAEQLKQISTAAAQSLEDVRNTAHALRPYELERLGLRRAIEDAAQKAAETSGVRFDCEVDPIDGLYPPETEVVLFRIVQEALNNVLRHARASEVIVEMKRESDRMRLTVLDNGCGFDAREDGSGAKAGFGLTNIAARAKMIGGQLRIESAAGRGTALTVHLPIKEKQV